MEIMEMLEREELMCWPTESTIKEARKIGYGTNAYNAKKDWQEIFALPWKRKLHQSDYEYANFPEGSYITEPEEWEEFCKIFDGKTEFTVEELVPKANEHIEVFNMLEREVSIMAAGGWYD